jgi:hypothetical protein
MKNEPTQHADPSDPKIDAQLAATSNATLREEHRALTTELLMELRNDLPEDQRADSYIVLDASSWTTLMACGELMSMFDAVAKRETLMSGKAGVLLGMDVLTDAYKHSHQRSALKADHVYVMAGDGSTGVAYAVTHPLVYSLGSSK